MRIDCLTGGAFATNSYFVINDLTKECILIDTFEQTSAILDYLAKNGLKCVAVLLTHGHFDHIGSVKQLQDMGAKVYMHKNDIWKIDAPGYMARMYGYDIKHFDVDYVIKKDETLDIMGLKVKVIQTPGHTEGGVCFVIDENIFSGDTIFRASYGRTDFEDGDFQKLKLSIKKIFNLEGEYMIFPGHGEITNSYFERVHNPILVDTEDIEEDF